jgi:hypothetical protein
LTAPGGACSFSAKAKEYAKSVKAVDILYSLPKDKLKEFGYLGIKKIYKNTDWMKNHNFAFYKNLDGHKLARAGALKDFLDDYNLQNYEYGALPNLRFESKEFDLALSGHFLFTYDKQFDYEFHKASILELCRVSKEVRIFPLVDMNNSKIGKDKPFSDFAYRILDELISMGYNASFKKVDFEFQRDANYVLHIVC